MIRMGHEHVVTIYDIAAKTGLSAATVSKVFNNYAGVSQKAKEAVLEAAREMGYTPNTNARALVTKKSWLISLLFSEDVGSGIAHPHFSQILQSFISGVQAHGYDLMFVNTSLRHGEISYLDHCRYRGVDGVLIAAGWQLAEDIQDLLASDYKCVSIEDIYPGTYTVLSDNYMGSMQALEHLYFLGHRKIAHIAGPLNSVAGRERFGAYRDFLAQKRLPYNPKYMVEAKFYNRESGIAAATELLQQCWDDMPTAIFAAYDEIACAVQTVLLSRGYRIPKDMSIVGFDNLAVSETSGITTIHQDRMGIGDTAANMLVNLIEGREVGDELITRLPTTLVVRDSCRRVAD